MTRRSVAVLATLAAALAAAVLPGPAASAQDIEPPRGVKVVPTGHANGQATVHWQAATYGDGSLYLVYHDRRPGQWWFAGSTTGWEYLVTGHNAGAAGLCYRVQRLWNGRTSNVSAHGCGSAWGPQQLAPPDPLTVASLGPDRLYVSWRRPEPNDGSAYEVHRYQPDNLRYVRVAQLGDVYSTHVAGLNRGEEYCFRVVRIRNGIRSPWSPSGCGVPVG
ncbi:MAG TPA: fibronectin type III domain-containing protein [Pseudonocardiaceae bacterium]